MPEAEITVDVALTRALLAEQHPELLDHGPLRVVANGWDNVLVRLGDDLVVRLPRRALAAPLALRERSVLPAVAARLCEAAPGVAVPVPVATGDPSDTVGYPWPWHVLRWVDGVSADRTPVPRRRAWASTLGTFLAALHTPAPPDAPHNPFRGIPLRERPEARDDGRLGARLAGLSPARRAAATRLWRRAVSAPAYDGPPVWLHGDPHPANLVVSPGPAHRDDDRLVAVVDFGDVTSGDPASDLAAMWLCFDATGRRAFHRATQARANGGHGWDEATWVRAAGWALMYATLMLAHPDHHPRLVPIGSHGLAQLLDA